MSGKSKETIEQLTDRYSHLNDHKIRAETNLQAALDRLNELKTDAKKEFGTDDLTELKKKLEELERENEKLRSDYQDSLDKIERDLEKVQANYDEPADSEPPNDDSNFNSSDDPFENDAETQSIETQSIETQSIDDIEEKPF